MNRSTPDAMLGIEDVIPEYERRLTRQSDIDRIKRPNGRDAILAQQRQEWPEYTGEGLMRAWEKRAERTRLALCLFLVSGTVTALFLWALWRWATGATWQ